MSEILPIGKPVKAITLTEPWASAVRLGLKGWETRSWPVNYRGLIAIHAAKTFPPDAKALAHARAGVLPTLPFLRLHLGCVLAVADLVRCEATRGLVLMKDSPLTYEISEQEMEWGDFSPGRFAFKLENVRPLSAPTWAKGQLGLWDWYPDHDVELLPTVAPVTRPPSAPIFSEGGNRPPFTPTEESR